MILLGLTAATLNSCLVLPIRDAIDVDNLGEFGESDSAIDNASFRFVEFHAKIRNSLGLSKRSSYDDVIDLIKLRQRISGRD
jgi:hypothetical protein